MTIPLRARVQIKMAAEEVEADEELRELVAQTLETKGFLSKIRVSCIPNLINHASMAY